MKILNASYEDKTNKPNKLQGKLRFGMLDYDRLEGRRDIDIMHGLAPSCVKSVKGLFFFTCLDQIKDQFMVKVGGGTRVMKRNQAVSFFQRNGGFGFSNGPTANDVYFR